MGPEGPAPPHEQSGLREGIHYINDDPAGARGSQ